jgi:tetratricopeptide (TPR) repeat protein
VNELGEAIRTGWAAALPEEPELTVAYFRSLVADHPTHPSALFAYASALDFAGEDERAITEYERAFESGLAGDELRQGLVQYGSTLRNIGRADDAVAVLREADERFPGHDSVRAFLALALVSADRGAEAVSLLLGLLFDG